MRQTAHKQRRYLNCLRIAVVPEYYEEQRLRSIVDFCKKYAFDNVMFFSLKVPDLEFNVKTRVSDLLLLVIVIFLEDEL